MKRGAAEMEGGAGEEEEGEEEEEEEEGDAEEEGEEEAEAEEEGEEEKERRQGQQEEGEDAEEEETGDAEDNMEEEVDEHHTPRHGSSKGAFSKKDVARSDDEEYERSAPASVAAAAAATSRAPSRKAKDNEDDEEEHLDMEFAKSQTADTAKLIAIMAQFTSEQTSRFECYRRSNFQKSNMRRLLQSVAGCPISMPMTIVMSGIAKMFVGELVETARTVMTERKEVGPTRPCHIREAYRRLKLKGKVPLRSKPRLFR